MYAEKVELTGSMSACGDHGLVRGATGSGTRTHVVHVGVRGLWIGERQLLGVAHVHMRVCTLRR